MDRTQKATNYSPSFFNRKSSIFLQVCSSFALCLLNLDINQQESALTSQLNLTKSRSVTELWRWNVEWTTMEVGDELNEKIMNCQLTEFLTGPQGTDFTDYQTAAKTECQQSQETADAHVYGSMGSRLRFAVMQTFIRLRCKLLRPQTEFSATATKQHGFHCNQDTSCGCRCRVRNVSLIKIRPQLQ